MLIKRQESINNLLGYYLDASIPKNKTKAGATKNLNLPSAISPPK